MPAGDLCTLLTQHDQAYSAQDWSTPWMDGKLKSKATIALDVAEAVVYLHSLKTPVTHRDLNTRNVLLDFEGNTKLSGFVISREVSMDETMTREVGSAAWMAPEVLRGERYDEKADVYSLGVLLVELDGCEHPYADQRSSGDVMMTNAEIARLACAGELRPSVSNGCSDPIASLVAKCLRFDASERPTSMAVSHAIRLIRKSTIEAKEAPRPRRICRRKQKEVEREVNAVENVVIYSSTMLG